MVGFGFCFLLLNRKGFVVVFVAHLLVFVFCMKCDTYTPLP